MKKFAILTAVVMLGATTAFAGTIVVPFFLDNGTADSVYGMPTSGAASWICVKNPSMSSSITITIDYYDNDGTPRGLGNTYSIPAGAAVSWRPIADDPQEGVGSTVPNKNGGSPGGTATITYPGTEPMYGRMAVFTGTTDATYGFMLYSN